jgi:hypothetical protein
MNYVLRHANNASAAQEEDVKLEEVEEPEKAQDQEAGLECEQPEANLLADL